MPPKWAFNPLTGPRDPLPPGSKGVSHPPESSGSELSDPPTSESDLLERLASEPNPTILEAEDGLEGEGELEAGPLEKALCLLRLYIEDQCRDTVSQETWHEVFTPRLSYDGCSLDKVTLSPEDAFESQYGFEGIRGCGNKTVPIYVFCSEGKNETAPPADLLIDLGVFLWGAWFRIYRSDIDCNEFIARVICPAFPRPPGSDKTPPHETTSHETTSHETTSHETTPHDTDYYVKTAVILNRGITDTFAQAQVALQDGLPLSPFRNMHIKPLFRALAILINESDYGNLKLSETEDDEEEVAMENLVVTLVSTGLDDGLTAPIEKLAAEVDGLKNVSHGAMTLGEAIEKVLRWEERERKAIPTIPLPPTIALNGHKPHRYLTSLTNLPYGLTKGIRWKQGPILGPSSTWVDPDKYRYPKGLAKTCLKTIKQYNQSHEAKYRLWVLEERRKIHYRAWYFWYKGLSQEERERTNGKEPSPKPDGSPS